MVGQITYTEDQILFILRLTLAKEKRELILQKYREHFDKPLSAAQLRYVKAKYGHDPEFGTALVNGTLPENGGNRKTAVPPPKQGAVQNIGSISHLSSAAIPDLVQPQIGCPGPLSTAHPNEQSLVGYSVALSATPTNVSSVSPSWRVKPQSKDNALSQISPDQTAALEPPDIPNGYQQLPQVAHDNPYGFQPAVQYYDTCSQFTSNQKRKREEQPAGSIPDMEACPTSFTGKGVVSMPSTATVDDVQDNDNKRLKLEPWVPANAYLLPQDLTEMSTNDIAYQQVGQESQASHTFGMAPGRSPYTLTDQPGNADGNQHNGETRTPSPLSKLLSEIDSEFWTQDIAMPTPASLQLPQTGTDTNISNRYSAQEAAAAHSMPVITGSDTQSMSTNTDLGYLEPQSAALWNSLINDANAAPKSDVSDHSTYKIPLTTEYDHALDPVLAHMIYPTLQWPENITFSQTDANSYGWNVEGLGSAAPTAVPPQFGRDQLDSSNTSSGFDWQILLSLDTQTQNTDGNFQLYPPSPLEQSCNSPEKLSDMEKHT